MEKSSGRLARISLFVAGIHCPSCVDHVSRLLDRETSAAAALQLSIIDVTVSYLSHTVAFTIKSQAQQSAEKEIQSSLEKLRKLLRHTVKLLSEEGYGVDALNVIRLDSGSAANDDGTETNAITLDQLKQDDPSTNDDAGCQKTSNPLSLRNRIIHPLEARKEASRRREQEQRWQRHLAACSSCRESSQLDHTARQQRQSSGSGTLLAHETGQNFAASEIPAKISVELAIGGMTCAACVGNIERAAQSIDGVEGINVNLLAGSARATVLDEHTLKDLLTAIEDSGYDVQMTKTTSLSASTSQDAIKSGKESGPQQYKATFAIDGMTCAACVTNIKGAVEAMDLPSSFKLTNFTVNLLQNTATAIIENQETRGIEADYAACVEEIRSTIEDAGYDAALQNTERIWRESRPSASKARARRARIAIDGMFCSQCIGKVHSAFRRHISEGHLAVQQTDLQALSLARPHVEVIFPPASPLKLRDLLDELQGLDPAFEVRLIKPISAAQRSAQRARRELYIMITRLCIAFLFVPPTLAIAVIIPTFLDSTNPIRQSIETKLVGEASKEDFILLGLATPVQFIVGSMFHTRAYKSLRSVWRRKRSWSDRFLRWGDMNVLVSLGTMVAYFASLAFLIVDATTKLPSADQKSTSSNMLYFDACVFLIFFILLGRVLEAATKRSTTSAIEALGSLRPTIGLLLESSDSRSTRTIDIDLLEIGDCVLIPHGASPPLDALLVSDAGGQMMDREASTSRPSQQNSEQGLLKSSSERHSLPQSSIELGAFSEAAISGESRPISKKPGDLVYAGTVNESSHAIVARIESPAGHCLIDSIVDAVRSAGSSGQKATIERQADRVTAHFVPIIVAISLLVLIIWLAILFSGAVSDDWVRRHANRAATSPQSSSLAKPKVLYALQFAVSCLVIACPCGIGLAAPTAHAVAVGLASKHGVLVQGGGQAFEVAVRFAATAKRSKTRRLISRLWSSKTSAIDETAFVFDKTGTLTTGNSGKVTAFRFLDDESIVKQEHSSNHATERRAAILKAVKEIEGTSTHPIGQALLAWCNEQLAEESFSQKISTRIVKVDEIAGRGLRALVTLHREDSREEWIRIDIGSLKLMSDVCGIPMTREITTLVKEWQETGGSVVYIAIGKEAGSEREREATPSLFAAVNISDSIRSEAARVIQYLSSTRSSSWIVSGDTKETTQAIAGQVSIPEDHVVAGVLPADKAEWVKRIRRLPKADSLKAEKATSELETANVKRLVAFVGDGINDGPALAAADLSVAMGSGSTLAQSSAMFVLMGGASQQRRSSKQGEGDKNGTEDGARLLEALPMLLTLSRATNRKVWQNLAWAGVFNIVCLPIAAGVIVPAGFTLGPSWSGLAMALSSTAVVLNALTLRLWRPPRLVSDTPLTN